MQLVKKTEANIWWGRLFVC